MVRNKVLDFIIEKIQWGEFKAGSYFYSEKELSIKLNVSQSTAKNALNFAEAVHLVKTSRGKRRIVLDFTKRVFITEYLNADDDEIRIEKETIIGRKDQRFLQKHFKHPLRFLFRINVFLKNEVIASFFSSTPNKTLFDSFLTNASSFLDILRGNKIVIEDIRKTMFVENGKICIKRYLFRKSNQLIEESLLVVNPKYFLNNTQINFFYSKNKLSPKKHYIN